MTIKAINVRNQFKGTIREIIEGDVLSEIDVQTAAGRSVGRRVKIDRVRLGPLEARDVDAVVIDVDLPYVLYGNSFLQDFHLQWGQGRLTLSVAPPP